ncbi:peroxisome membrane protein [Syncephalis fuscata]|nr:peroxisome membrane protein [Syncephalis fuscata]
MWNLLRDYETFLLNNASQISSIESSLRSFTYILPGRFHDAELASESLFAFLNLIGLYHDAVIRQALATRRHRVASLPGTPATDLAERPPTDPIAQHNVYTRALWQSDNARYLSLILTLVKTTEVTAEMLVRRRWGNDARWRLVIAIEAIKAALRLVLLRQSDQRTLLSPPHPVREVDPAMVEEVAHEMQLDEEHQGRSTATASSLSEDGRDSRSVNATWKGHRTGKQIPQLASVMTGSKGRNDAFGGLDQLLGGGGSRDDGVTDFLLNKVLRVEDVLGPLQLVRPRRGLHLLGEWLFILRPVIYVMAIRRYGLGAWRPWLASFFIELLAYKAATQQRKGESMATTLEQDEFSRRKRLFLLYMLRSPFYYRYTKSRVDGVRNWLSSKPLLSLIGSIIGNYQPLWESLYFYTSGS